MKKSLNTNPESFFKKKIIIKVTTENKETRIQLLAMQRKKEKRLLKIS